MRPVSAKMNASEPQKTSRTSLYFTKNKLCSIEVQKIEIDFHEWGGRRDGAGRPRMPGRGRVPHRRRERHQAAHPVHVTIQVREGLPPIREPVLFRALPRRLS